MCSIFRVTTGLPEKQINTSSVSQDLWFQDPSGLKEAQRALTQDPGELFLPGPQKGCSFFEACHPQCSTHNLSGAVGVGLRGRRAQEWVGVLASGLHPLGHLEGGWQTARPSRIVTGSSPDASHSLADTIYFADYLWQNVIPLASLGPWGMLMGIFFSPSIR